MGKEVSTWREPRKERMGNMNEDELEWTCPPVLCVEHVGDQGGDEKGV